MVVLATEGQGCEIGNAADALEHETRMSRRGGRALLSSGRQSAGQGNSAMFTRFAALALSFLQAKEGVVAIQMAIMMPLLIGMGALAIDVGFVLEKQRQMQSAADAAAYSAAIAKTTGYPAAFSTEAYAVAGKVGFVNSANGVTVTVNNPTVSPLNAANAANASAIQVIVQQPQTLPLVGAVCSIIHEATCSGTFNVAA
jgi:Flp pilus assembly protein TadG